MPLGDAALPFQQGRLPHIGEGGGFLSALNRPRQHQSDSHLISVQPHIVADLKVPGAAGAIQLPTNAPLSLFHFLFFIAILSLYFGKTMDDFFTRLFSILFLPRPFVPPDFTAESMSIASFGSPLRWVSGFAPPPSVIRPSISAAFSGACGFGCAARSRSFAERRPVLAASIGPKTLLLSFWLFAFMELDLELFAMLLGLWREFPGVD